MDSINEIRARLGQAGLDAMLITSAPNRFYAAGFPSSDGVVFVGVDKAYYFTDFRYLEAAEKAVKNARVLPVDMNAKYSDRINEAIAACGAVRLGFEEDAVSCAQYRAYSESLRAELEPAQDLLSRLRTVKRDWEIENLIAAQRIAERAFDDILGVVSTEMTEKELAAELCYRMLKYGAENMSFDPIVVSAEKTSMPHGTPGDVRIGRGFLTMDFGCVYNGYCSDMTRTVAVGEATGEMRRVYDIVLEAQLRGIAAARAGATGREIDAAAREAIAAAGYGGYFTHSFGHGVGIEVHERPSASPAYVEQLPAGSVISAEPGIYLPGKFGVRIEDVIVITENGCRNITKTPKELLILS